MRKILWVKFGWSDYYRGEPINGDFSWLNNRDTQHKGPGHEAFNFDPGPDGTYYCYVPPQRKTHCPRNDAPHGWTVVCLAKKPKHTGLHIVGWFENATLHGEWLLVPDEVKEKRHDSSMPEYDWFYSITSKEAYFVPPECRTMPFSDASIRIGKYSFLSGRGVAPTENKKRVLQILGERMAKLRRFAVANPSESRLPDPVMDAADPLRGFGSAEVRKNVEVAAERAVIAHYENLGYQTERCTHLPCGYDFAFTKGNSVLRVEVKGTAGPLPRFYLTRNEHKKGMQSDALWRLALVTSALTTPSIKIYNSAELGKAFDLEPYVYIGNFISEP